MRFYKGLLLVCLLFLCSFEHTFAGFNFSHRNSTINVGSGKLIVNTTIPNWSGTLIQTGAVTGQPITFNQGVLETSGTPALFTGNYDDDLVTQVMLSQNQSIRIDSGRFSKRVLVQGTGNRLEGQPVFTQTNAIRLANPASSLTLALNAPITTSIAMNGGQLVLDGDVNFTDDNSVTGSGTINVNGKRFAFGGPFTSGSLKLTHTLRWNDASDVVLNGPLSLSGTWTFNASTAGNQPRILGNGNTLDLTQRGTIYIKRNTILNLTNVKIKGLGRGGFVMEDKTSQLRLSDVEIEMANSYTVTSGGMYVDGISTIITKAGLLTFSLRSSLTVDGVTLWYDPVNTPDLFNIRPLIASAANPSNKLVTYLNSGIIRGVADNSLIRATSNAMLALNRNNSNTLLFLERTDSNAKLFLTRNNSNAIIALARTVRTNSNAAARGIRNNSNAILNLAASNNTSFLANLRYLSNSLLYLNRTSSNANARGIRNNSNAILNLAASNRNNSNTLLFLERTDSATKIFLARNLSNALLFLNRNNSNAIITLNRTVRTNSNAAARGIRNNSNAILNLAASNNTSFLANLRYLSNSLLYLNRTSSNANARGIRNNSNAILNLGAANRNNSNTLLFLERTDSATKIFLARNLSNTLLFLNRNNSNAIITANNTIRTNSNAHARGIRNNSNAILNLAASNNTSFLANLRYLSNSLLYLNRTSSNANARGIRNNSNAILNLGAANRNNSNTLLFLERTDSATKIFLARNLSNTLLFLNRNNSNAIITLNRTVRTNSNAHARGIRNNSNAIMNLLNPNNTNSLASSIRYVSNSLLYLNRTSSNADARGIRNNSNAILNLSAGNRNNSNTLLFLERTDSATKIFLARNLSNTLLFLNRNNSNAIITANTIIRTNSNAHARGIRNNSNAIMNLLNPSNTNSLVANIRYLSNSLLYLNRTSSNADARGIRNNSNAILNLSAGNRNNSNTLLFLERTDSATKIFLARNLSNTLLFLNRNNSNAIITANTIIRTNSNAHARGIRNNSNAIMNLLNPNNTNSLTANIRYLSNSLLYLNRTSSNAHARGIRNNSNAILNLGAGIRNNSNTLLFLERTDSATKIFLARNLSNTLLFLTKNNSNAIMNLLNPSNTNSLVANIRYLSNSLLYLNRTSSNADARGIRNNSNTLLFLERTDSATKIFLARNLSNSLLFLNRNNSNAIINLCTKIRTNSNANARGIRNNSNAILNLKAGIRNNSNTLLFLTRNNSNAIINLINSTTDYMSHLTINNSNALLFLTKNLSNSLLYLTKNNSNALLFCCNNSNGGAAPFGCRDISGTLDLTENINLGSNDCINIVGDTCIDGHGVEIEFSNQAFPQFTVNSGVTVLIKNVTFTDITQNTFDFRNNSLIQIGENVIWELDTDVTFSANSVIQVLDGTDGCTPITGDCNIFTIRGETCRRTFHINPLVNQLSNGQPHKIFNLGHNTVKLESAALSGFDYMTFFNGDVCSAAVALSCNAAADISSSFPAANGRFGTAINFFVEGQDNDIILRQDGLFLSGNITFGDFPDNDLHIRFNLAELADPTDPVRAGVLNDFPVVELAGNPGIFLFSSDGVAKISFDDFNAAARGSNDNAFVVDDNGLLSFNRLQIVDNPIKQQSAHFRFEGIELLDQRIDPGFIRLPRGIHNNILITAMHIMRQHEKDMFALAQKQAQAYAKATAHGHHKPAAAKVSKKRPHAKYRHEINELMDGGEVNALPIVRALNLPVSFDQSYVGQILNPSTPISGNIEYNRTQLNDFIVDPNLAFNILIQDGTVIALGADVVLNTNHKINVKGLGNVIKMPFGITIGADNLFLDEGAELTFQFASNTTDIPELIVTNNTIFDIEAGATIRLSGKGIATFGDDVLVNFKGVKTVHPVTKAETVSSRGYFVITDDATLRLAAGAKSRMQGVGHVEVTKRGKILLDNPSSLIFGIDDPTVMIIIDNVDPIFPSENFHDIIFNVFDDGEVILKPGKLSGGGRARLSFRYLTSVIKFENSAFLFVDDNGTFEINADRQVPNPSKLKELSLRAGILEMRGSGRFAMGSNKLNLGTGQPYPFSYDGVASLIEGTGTAQFIASGSSGFEGSINPTAAARDEVSQQTAFNLIRSLIGLSFV